jgi:hypothetical protein
LQGEVLEVQGNTVTLMALGFAQMLGCNPIILAGVDLAYTEGLRYAPGVEANNHHPMHSIDDHLVKTKNRQGTEVISAVRWMSERDDIGDFAKRHPEISCFNTTKSGLPIPGWKYRSSFRFQHERELRLEIHQKIEAARMGVDTDKKISAFCLELKESLDRMVEFLRIIQGTIRGKSKVLAEIDLKEEICYDLFFRDLDDAHLLEKVERYRDVFL